jgi:SAM-dependent methyltransferase
VDLALCLGNTLAHLPDRSSAERAVRGMAGVLAPGGRLVVQCVNFDRILAEGRAAFPLIERTRPDSGRISFFREYDLSGLPERLIFRTRLATPGGEHHAAWPLVPLRSDELSRWFGNAGLTGVMKLGDYDRSPFTGTSPALIVVGDRPPVPGS